MFAVGSKKGWHSLPLVLFALLCPSITAPFLPFCHSTNVCVCVCLCKIKCSANTFLLLLSCSHASLSCVFSSYLAFSAFTLDGCAIISRDQWWPCPVFFLALEADGLLYSVIALFHTCPLLAFCMCTSVCLLWLFVHIWPLSLSLREAELEKED